MGFVHPEDFASEIKEALNINIGIADIIAAEINKKIFSQFKNDLEKIYQPVSSGIENLEESEAPILDLRNRAEESSFKIVEDENQKQENKIDLSKEIKKENVAIPQVEPVIIEKTVLSEKEEKRVEELAPAASTGPLKEEGPLIIHQETEFKPLSGKLKSLGGMFNFLRSKDEFKKEEAPVKAELEIGEEFKIAEEPKLEEYKPEPFIKEAAPEIIKEIVEEKEIPKEIKVVNYGEEPEPEISETSAVPISPVAPIEPVKETILDLSKKAESMPENLPVAEEIAEIKPEIKISQEAENIEPKIEPKKESEEMIDLGMFK